MHLDNTTITGEGSLKEENPKALLLTNEFKFLTGTAEGKLEKNQLNIIFVTDGTMHPHIDNRLNVNLSAVAEEKTDGDFLTSDTAHSEIVQTTAEHTNGHAAPIELAGKIICNVKLQKPRLSLEEKQEF